MHNHAERKSKTVASSAGEVGAGEDETCEHANLPLSTNLHTAHCTLCTAHRITHDHLNLTPEHKHGRRQNTQASKPASYYILISHVKVEFH